MKKCSKIILLQNVPDKLEKLQKLGNEYMLDEKGAPHQGYVKLINLTSEIKSLIEAVVKDEEVT